MKIINIITWLLLLHFGALQTQDNQEISIKSDQVIQPAFDSKVFRGAEILKWRDKNIKTPFAGIVKTKDGIYIPEKTLMIDVKPPGDEFRPFSLGIGKVLKESEKDKLPKEILDAIYNHYAREEAENKQNSTEAFVVIAFAEAYKISVVYNKSISGTMFLALVKVAPNEFQKLAEFENIKPNNHYINIPLLSAHFVLFYRDRSGKYQVLKVGAGG